MAIQIKYQNADGSWSDLDVDQSEVMRITGQVMDYKDPSKRKSNISKTFTLPPSEVNSQFFGVFQDPTFQSGVYSPYVTQPVEVFSGDELIFRGNLALEGIDRENPKFNVRIFGRLNTLGNIFGETLLGELDWSEYDHIFSEQNIRDSWDGLLALLAGGTTDEILYPLADWGKGYGYNGFDIGNNSSPVNANDFYPAMKLETMLVKMFEKNGLVLDLSDFNYPDFDLVFHQLYVEKEKSIKQQDFSFLADLAAGGNQYSNLPVGTPVIDDVIIYRAEIDQGGNFDDTNHRYIVPANGTYQFGYSIQAEWSRPGTFNASTMNVEISLFDNGSIVPGTTLLQNVSIPGGDTQSGSFLLEDLASTVNLNLSIGDFVDVRISVSIIGDTGMTVNLNLVQLSQFKTNSAPSVFTGGILDISKTMGDLKQIDLLKAFLNQWNLIIEQDFNIEQNFRVLSYDDWIDEGTLADWTDILDVSKPVVIQPATEYMKKDIVYRLLQTDDDLNKSYLDYTGFTYGATHIQTGIAYTNGEQNLFTIWAPYPTSRIDDFDMYVARYYKDQDNPALEKIAPQLFFYNGVLDSGGRWKVDDFQGGSTNLNIYPNCSNFRYNINDQVDQTSQDLNFSFAFPFDADFYVIEPTALTIYNQYHLNYNNRLYKESNRIIKANIFLTVDRANQLRMNDTIRIRFGGSADEYLLLLVKEYPVNIAESVNVILMKK